MQMPTVQFIQFPFSGEVVGLFNAKGPQLLLIAYSIAIATTRPTAAILRVVVSFTYETIFNVKLDL